MTTEPNLNDLRNAARTLVEFIASELAPTQPLYTSRLGSSIDDSEDSTDENFGDNVDALIVDLVCGSVVIGVLMATIRYLDPDPAPSAGDYIGDPAEQAAAVWAEQHLASV